MASFNVSGSFHQSCRIKIPLTLTPVLIGSVQFKSGHAKRLPDEGISSNLVILTFFGPSLTFGRSFFASASWHSKSRSIGEYIECSQLTCGAHKSLRICKHRRLATDSWLRLRAFLPAAPRFLSPGQRASPGTP